MARNFKNDLGVPILDLIEFTGLLACQHRVIEERSDRSQHAREQVRVKHRTRRVLGLQITRPYQMQNGSLRAITLDPRLELR